MNMSKASVKASVIADLGKGADEFTLSAKYRIQSNVIRKWGVEVGILSSKKKTSKEKYLDVWKTMKSEGKSQKEVFEHIQGEFGVTVPTIKRILRDQPDYEKTPHLRKISMETIGKAFELFKQSRSVDEIVNATKLGKARVAILIDAWSVAA
jgi:hypothetical protein